MKKNYAKYSDEQLAAMADSGDDEAIDYLINKYKNMVRSKAHLYFIVGGDTEDIVQEGLIGIFKAIKYYDGSREASFKTFAELCINRQIYTAIKNAGRLKHLPLNDFVSVDFNSVSEVERTLYERAKDFDHDSEPESRLMTKDIMEEINLNRNNLFSKLELAVLREYLSGKTNAEISETLGKSPKSVDNAIQRSKRKISSYFEE